jgi:hypothetical protein
MIVGDGRVRAIAEIGAVVPVDDRKALTGQLLTAGHPLYDAYIGTPDPLANDSQNSITYGDLPGEVELRLRPCGCGCGQDTERDFVPGHEMRAIQQRVRVHFDGSTTAFLAWLDAALHSATNGLVCAGGGPVSTTVWWMLGAAAVAGFIVSWWLEVRRPSPAERVERAAIRALWKLAKRTPVGVVLRDPDMGMFLGVQRFYGFWR